MIPAKLYKYRSMSLISLETLLGNSIWLASPKMLNDPFDAQQHVDTQMTFEEYQTIWRPLTRWVYGGRPSPTFRNNPNMANEYQDRIDQLVSEYRLIERMRDIGVYSLSEKCDHQLLWAHYANGHTGFALEYSVSPLPENSDIVLRGIEYRDECPPLRFVDLFSVGREKVVELASIKSAEWSYESEWRLLSSCSDVLLQSPWPLCGIVFGFKMPAPHRELIRRICGNGPTYKEATPLPGNYQMEIRDCV